VYDFSSLADFPLFVASDAPVNGHRGAAVLSIIDSGT